MKKLEALLEWGGVKRDVTFLVLSGLALLASILFGERAAVDPAWVAIFLCGVPIILEAIIGLVTAFDIKADVLVSIALIASVVIGEDFAAGEVAFIMQLGALLEDLTVARGPGGNRKAGPPDTPHRTPGGGDRRRDHSGGAGTGGRPDSGPAGGDHPGGRRDRMRPDLHRPGGHDRRVPARGQGTGGRGLQRNRESVRGV